MIARFVFGLTSLFPLVVSGTSMLITELPISRSRGTGTALHSAPCWTGMIAIPHRTTLACCAVLQLLLAASSWSDKPCDVLEIFTLQHGHHFWR